jgi:hypothetical protein
VIRTELTIEYDEQMKPISAIYAGCGENMPAAPAEMQTASDIIEALR